jgi:Uma2 family endonuclease
MEALRQDKRYTYAEYAGWPDDGKRYELIDGVVYMMAPAPTWEHQDISAELLTQLRVFLKGKPCKAFAAPFDVRLNASAGDDTVVQPDLVVVCDRLKLSGAGCVGAPDFVVEILSRTSANRDRVLKFNQYLKAGVREYWIVDPDSKTVIVNILDNGRYYTTAYGETDTVSVNILEGCTISLSDVFAE